MEKNKYLLVALLFALSACMKDESELWGHFNQKVQTRTPAQAQGVARPKCFVDRLQDSAIQAEVNQWESAYGDGKRGDYLGRTQTLNDLPGATLDALQQSTYIDKNLADYWITVGATQKNCKDLSCIINADYAKPTREGLLHYWYFLKTGYSMGAFQGYPWYESGKTSVAVAPNFALETYLFNQKEWSAWWLQANLLPKSMYHMGSLRSIHRAPHGYIPPDWRTSGTCGWALGTQNEGIILLSDECLTLNFQNTFDKDGYFYTSTIHEEAHRLSAWNFGKKRVGSASIDLDLDPEFLKLSNWHLEELVGADGKATRQWKSDASAGWVTYYSRTSPAEDFAEDVGYFRTTPKQLFDKAPQKYAFIKERVYGGHGYTYDELKVQYTKQLNDRILSEIDQWVTPCLSETPDVPALNPQQKLLAARLNLDLPISPQAKSCLSAQFALKINQILSDIRFDEPEGCEVLDSNESVITQTALPLAIAGVTSYLKSDTRLSELIGGVKNFRAAVNQEFDAKAIFLACLSEEHTPECYQAKASSEFDRLYLKFKVQLSAGTESLVPLEKNHFLALYAFEDVRAKVSEFYNGLFAGYSGKIEELAKSVWTTCSTLRVTPVTGQISTQPYSGGAFYIAPSILACLNEQTGIQMAAVRSLAAGDHGIDLFSEGSKDWINLQIIFPHFKAVFDNLVVSSQAAEVSKLNEGKDKAVSDVYAILTTNQAWRNSNSAYSYPDCKVAAFNSLPDKIGADQFRFTAIEPIEGELVDQICEKVRQWIVSTASAPSSSNQLVIPGSVSADQKATLEPAWASLKKLMLTQASTRFPECRRTVYFGKVGKRFCLFTELVVDDGDHFRKNAWKWTSNRAVRQWIALPEVNEIMAKKGYSAATISQIADARLDDERQSIGDDILSAFFK